MTYELTDSQTVDAAESLLNEYSVEPKRLRHFNARTIEEAIQLLDEAGDTARVIAGGVDLVSLMKNKMVRPKLLVNIKTVPEMSYVTEDAEGLKIGALTTLSEIVESIKVRKKYSVISDAASKIGAWQIRNMSTIAGNLCQDSRCWYYRRSPLTGGRFICHRKGGKVCYAIGGDNRYHAIIANGECAGVCPSDMASALTVLGAKLKTVSPHGERLISLDEFYTVMGNILQPSEIITEIQVPNPITENRQGFLKFSLRKALDFALSSVAAVINIEGRIVSDAKIVLGGISPIPYRAILAEEILKGKPITEDTAEASAKAALLEAKPLKMNAYKVKITKSLVKKLLLQLSEL